jgi:hypothetical protein
MAPLLSVPACNLAEFVSRFSAALMYVHDLPAAIRPRSRLFSSDVHRILGTTQSFLRFFAPSSERDLDASGWFPKQYLHFCSSEILVLASRDRSWSLGKSRCLAKISNTPDARYRSRASFRRSRCVSLRWSLKALSTFRLSARSMPILANNIGPRSSAASSSI